MQYIVCRIQELLKGLLYFVIQKGQSWNGGREIVINDFIF